MKKLHKEILSMLSIFLGSFIVFFWGVELNSQGTLVLWAIPFALIYGWLEAKC